MNSGGKNRISWLMAIILLIIAFCVDFVNPIPGLGGILTAMYWIAFSFYLWKTGHGLLNLKNIIPSAFSTIIEWLPGISIVPTVVFFTFIIIVLSRIEDKTGISLIPKGKPTGISKRAEPLNSTPGIRKPIPRKTEEI